MKGAKKQKRKDERGKVIELKRWKGKRNRREKMKGAKKQKRKDERGKETELKRW